MTPNVRSYLSSSESEIWLACDASGTAMRFMGMSGSKMDAWFLAPEFHGRGAGRLLVRHAQSPHPELTVDVNEQNAAARRFYETCAFVVEGWLADNVWASRARSQRPSGCLRYIVIRCPASFVSSPPARGLTDNVSRLRV